MISYRSSLRFVPVQWFLAELWPLDFENLTKYLVVTTFFRYAWRYWFDFWYESVWWWVTDQDYISFRSNDFWSSYVSWTLKFGQIFSCHPFISLWFEILTWFLVWECIIICYRSTLKFFVILSLLLRELNKGETFASLLNIHGGDIHVIPTHLVPWTICYMFNVPVVGGLPTF